MTKIDDKIFSHTKEARLKREISTPSFTIRRGEVFKYYPLDNVWTGFDTEGRERNYKNIDVDTTFFEPIRDSEL